MKVNQGKAAPARTSDMDAVGMPRQVTLELALGVGQIDGMPSTVNVAIHSSQFPEQVRKDLWESLRTRRVNHKFHYDSVKQTQKWLELHQAYSPSRTDPDCAAIYGRGFAEVISRLSAPAVCLVGLGCGGGQKDTRILSSLSAAGKKVAYVASDVSTAMVLEARNTALKKLPTLHCIPLVCDLAAANDLQDFLEEKIGNLQERTSEPYARLFTFFGMLPNFEPELILPRLASLVRPADYLLFSANLAPGTDYDAGVRRILPLYDNELTRDWLMTFLSDIGVEKADGELRFVIEEAVRSASGPCPKSTDEPAQNGLKRISAYFHFVRPREIRVDVQKVVFEAGESIRLFFSYRHTPALVRKLLNRHGLEVHREWGTSEEGVFLVRRAVAVSD